jgi:hypothetical protein
VNPTNRVREELSDCPLDKEDIRLLVDFFLLLRKWDAKEKADPPPAAKDDKGRVDEFL